MEEELLSADMRRLIDDISLAASVGLGNSRLVHDERMTPNDDVLLYELGFKHEMSCDVLWRRLKSGSSICAELDKGSYVLFSYVPSFDPRDKSTHHRTKIGTARYAAVRDMLREFDGL